LQNQCISPAASLLALLDAMLDSEPEAVVEGERRLILRQHPKDRVAPAIRDREAVE